MSKSANKLAQRGARDFSSAEMAKGDGQGPYAGLIRQAWLSLVVWIGFGILLEGFNAFRSAAVLDDHVRREMFRLAHAHGTLLNLLCLVAALSARLDLIRLPAHMSFTLRVAVLLLPLGFLLGGIWHYKDEPGTAILLVPIGAVLLLVVAVYIALTLRRKS